MHSLLPRDASFFLSLPAELEWKLSTDDIEWIVASGGVRISLKISDPAWHKTLSIKKTTVSGRTTFYFGRKQIRTTKEERQRRPSVQPALRDRGSASRPSAARPGFTVTPTPSVLSPPASAPTPAPALAPTPTPTPTSTSTPAPISEPSSASTPSASTPSTPPPLSTTPSASSTLSSATSTLSPATSSSSSSSSSSLSTALNSTASPAVTIEQIVDPAASTELISADLGSCDAYTTTELAVSPLERRCSDNSSTDQRPTSADKRSAPSAVHGTSPVEDHGRPSLADEGSLPAADSTERESGEGEWEASVETDGDLLQSVESKLDRIVECTAGCIAEWDSSPWEFFESKEVPGTLRYKYRRICDLSDDNKRFVTRALLSLDFFEHLQRMGYKNVHGKDGFLIQHIISKCEGSAASQPREADVSNPPKPISKQTLHNCRVRVDREYDFGSVVRKLSDMRPALVLMLAPVLTLKGTNRLARLEDAEAKKEVEEAGRLIMEKLASTDAALTEARLGDAVQGMLAELRKEQQQQQQQQQQQDQQVSTSQQPSEYDASTFAQSRVAQACCADVSLEFPISYDDRTYQIQPSAQLYISTCGAQLPGVTCLQKSIVTEGISDPACNQTSASEFPDFGVNCWAGDMPMSYDSANHLATPSPLYPWPRITDVVPDVAGSVDVTMGESYGLALEAEASTDGHLPDPPRNREFQKQQDQQVSRLKRPLESDARLREEISAEIHRTAQAQLFDTQYSLPTGGPVPDTQENAGYTSAVWTPPHIRWGSATTLQSRAPSLATYDPCITAVAARQATVASGLLGTYRVATPAGNYELESLYHTRIVPSRSPFGSRIYEAIAPVSLPLVRALSASYLRTDDRLAHRQEAYNEFKLKTSQGDLAVVIPQVVLWLHLSIIEDAYQSEWQLQVKILGSVLKPALREKKYLQHRLKIASHTILAVTLKEVNKVEFLGANDDHLDAIDVMTGLSPQLLNTIQDITFAATWHLPSLRERLRSIQQLDPTEACAGTSELALQVIRSTAIAYRQAASLYLEYRWGVNAFSDESLLSTQLELLQTLEEIPLKGELFTASWPLWSFFILCICPPSSGKKRVDKMLVDLIQSSSGSNILPVTRAIDTLWAQSVAGVVLGGWNDVIDICGDLSLT